MKKFPVDRIEGSSYKPPNQTQEPEDSQPATEEIINTASNSSETANKPTDEEVNLETNLNLNSDDFGESTENDYEDSFVEDNNSQEPEQLEITAEGIEEISDTSNNSDDSVSLTAHNVDETANYVPDLNQYPYNEAYEMDELQGPVIPAEDTIITNDVTNPVVNSIEAPILNNTEIPIENNVIDENLNTEPDSNTTNIAIHVKAEQANSPVINSEEPVVVDEPNANDLDISSKKGKKQLKPQLVDEAKNLLLGKNKSYEIMFLEDMAQINKKDMLDNYMTPISAEDLKTKHLSFNEMI